MTGKAASPVPQFPTDAAITTALTFHNDRKRKNRKTIGARAGDRIGSDRICAVIWESDTYCLSGINTDVSQGVKSTYDRLPVKRERETSVCI